MIESAKLHKKDFSSLNSRFNAHLTFNILNTVQGLILENEKEKAFEFIGLYSKLLRRMLIHNNIEIKLREELDIVRDYLEIEKTRMDYNFQYSISVSKSLESKYVPKSMLIGLVENAVKHGIRPLLNNGYLKIDSPSTDSRMIRIRNNAPLLSTSKGLGCGMGMNKEILERFNQQTDSLINMSSNSITNKVKNEIEFVTLISLSFLNT